MTQPTASGTPYGPIEPPAHHLLRLIKSRKSRTGRVTENAQFMEALWRWVRAAEVRAIEDPEMLPQLFELSKRMADAVNVAIAANAERFAIDPRLGASMAECARILGIKKQSASDRRKLGAEIINARLRKAGAVKLKYSEAKEEKQIIRDTAAKAIIGLDEWRKRKAG